MSTEAFPEAAAPVPRRGVVESLAVDLGMTTFLIVARKAVRGGEVIERQVIACSSVSTTSSC